VSPVSSRPSSLQRRLLALAIPNAVSGLTVPLAGLVDVAMLGHLGEIHHLAGVGLASILFDYLYWGFGFLKMSTQGLTAQAAGAGNDAEAGVILGRAAVTAIAIGAILLIAAPIVESFGFALLSGGNQTEEVGREYFRARLWGAPAALLNFVAIGWLLGRERSVAVLVMTAIATTSNIGLDIVLIYSLELGAYGAGLASMLSQYAMLGVAALMVLREKPDFAELRSRFADPTELAKLFLLNRDLMIRTFCLITAFATFTNISASLGTSTLAANTIALMLLTTAAYFIDGLAFAAQSLAGIYRGSDDSGSLRLLLRSTLTWGLGCAAAVAAPITLFPELIFPMLTSHSEVMDIAAAHAPWLCATIAAGSVAYVLDGYFIGLTEGRILRNAMLISLLVFAMPAAAASLSGSNTILWSALVLFMGTRAITLGIHIPATLTRATVKEG
jgi:MATE family multidrug resistance protein